MALLRVFALIFFFMPKSVFGEYVQVILGDPVTFGNCSADEPAELHRDLDPSSPPVAEITGGVCRPADAYRRRVDLNSCFAFRRSVYTDSGVYQLTCSSGDPRTIRLDVVVGSEASVAEGDPVRLRCSFITAQRPVDSVRWTRNGAVVLERNLSTGETRTGPGLETRVSLSPGGGTQGDWSLIWDRVLLEDQGHYSCAFYNKGVREKSGDPAAVRLKVTQGKRAGTSLSPPPPQSEEEHEGTGNIVGYISLSLVLGLVVGLGLGWIIRSKLQDGGGLCPRVCLNTELPKSEEETSSLEDSGV